MESCIECNLETKHFIHPSDSWHIHNKVVFQPLFADSFRETLHAVLQRSAVMASSTHCELLELEEILFYTRWNTSKRIRQVVLSEKGWYIWKNSLRTVFLWVFEIAPCRINQFPLPISWCRLGRTRVVFCRSFWKNNNTSGECSSCKPNELELILDCFLRKSVSVQWFHLFWTTLQYPGFDILERCHLKPLSRNPSDGPLRIKKRWIEYPETSLGGGGPRFLMPDGWK